MIGQRDGITLQVTFCPSKGQGCCSIRWQGTTFIISQRKTTRSRDDTTNTILLLVDGTFQQPSRVQIVDGEHTWVTFVRTIPVPNLKRIPSQSGAPWGFRRRKRRSSWLWVAVKWIRKRRGCVPPVPIIWCQGGDQMKWSDSKTLLLEKFHQQWIRHSINSRMGGKDIVHPYSKGTVCKCLVGGIYGQNSGSTPPNGTSVACRGFNCQQIQRFRSD